MINYAKKSLLLALLAGIGFGATVAQAQERVYVIDQRDVVAKSGFGLCWRDGYWTPAAAAADKAGCECDKDLLPKETCEPKMAAAPAAPVAAVPVRRGALGHRVQPDALHGGGRRGDPRRGGLHGRRGQLRLLRRRHAHRAGGLGDRRAARRGDRARGLQAAPDPVDAEALRRHPRRARRRHHRSGRRGPRAR